MSERFTFYSPPHRRTPQVGEAVVHDYANEIGRVVSVRLPDGDEIDGREGFVVTVEIDAECEWLGA